MIQFQELTDSEIKSIAVDFCEGKIFSDRHIPTKQTDRAIMMVFMPLALGAGKDWSMEVCEQIGMLCQPPTDQRIGGLAMLPAFAKVLHAIGRLTTPCPSSGAAKLPRETGSLLRRAMLMAALMSAS